MTGHFLESLDSVRAPGAGRRHVGQPDAAELQAGLEVLLTLAMGNHLVVPQPYAFDSWVFLRVAERVLAARARAGAVTDRPMRLHLHRADGFDDAISAMLRRVHDPRQPFHSSLFPRLVDDDPARVARWADDPASFVRSIEDDDLAGMIGLIREEFRAIPAHRTHVTGEVPGVGPRLQALLPGLRTAAGNEGGGVPGRLVDAVAELGGSSSPGFAVRSLLRSDVPWPGDHRGRAAHEILDRASHEVLVEVVDTTYNRVLVESMGDVTATFTTAVGRATTTVDTLHRAQSLALPPSAAAGVPGFQVLVRPVGTTEPAVVSGLADRLDVLLLEVFAARRDRRSPLWQSLRRLQDASDAGDLARAADALERHVDVLGEMFRDKGTVHLTDRATLMSLLGTAATSAGSLATLLAGASGLVQLLVPTAIGLASVGAVPLRRRRRVASEGRRVAEALGHFVGVE